MPKTTVQQIIFGLLMSYFMAIGMEIYNTAINSGVTQLAGGFSALSYEVILDALKEASYMASSSSSFPNCSATRSAQASWCGIPHRMIRLISGS